MIFFKAVALTLVLHTTLITVGSVTAQWSPKQSPIKTRWASGVSPDKVWPEYPRPQMIRNEWMNLNGLWEYAIRPRDESQPEKFDGQILVPFCAESALSGVMQRVGEENRLWYQRMFRIDPSNTKQEGRTLLHFGAVDWHAVVWVNGQKVGEHRGGYDPFTFDITHALQDPGKDEQELTVAVWDPSDSSSQARGKQVKTPGGIWYTPVTGIWQTVWLETVPTSSIKRIQAVPDVDRSALLLTVVPRGDTKQISEQLTVQVVASDHGKTIAHLVGKPNTPLTLQIPDQKLWSPDSPHLYDLKVKLCNGYRVIDSVDSYFAMRKIEIAKAPDGHNRLMLNGEALFQYGPLDQGWWPDGLYTPPSDKAMRYDIEQTKQLGFNMIRKHVKVEPARWYRHCDELGMLVWQDMPGGMVGHRGPQHVMADWDHEADMPVEHRKQFEHELAEMIRDFGHFPCIVMWVPFNEGWGQYDTTRIADDVKRLDPSRLVNSISGWLDRGAGDVLDIHHYPGPGYEPSNDERAVVLGEFGGLGMVVPEHSWQKEKNWGYVGYPNRESLQNAYAQLIDNLDGPIALGLSAAVYTQTTDVEPEINGLMTYDRELLKYDPDATRAVHQQLYDDPYEPTELLPTSQFVKRSWRFMNKKPGNNWFKPDFDDSHWSEKVAPFQPGDHRYIQHGSRWNSNDLWLRTTFNVQQIPERLYLNIAHLTDAFQVYINGKLVLDLEKPRPTNRHYQHLEITEHRDSLKQGQNVLAVYAKKGHGLRIIDVGVYGLNHK